MNSTEKITVMDKTAKLKIAVSIFLTAFAFGFNITGISPVLGVINELYSNVGTSLIQLLQTLPYLLLMVGAMMVGWLTTKLSKKKIILIGLLIIGICGSMPFLSESFVLLFLSRLIIGFGFGIVGPMNTAIAADFFPPEERATYTGLHVVGMGVGTMVGNLLGGLLANIQYRCFYLIYLTAFISIIGVQFLLPETPPDHGQKASEMKMNKEVYLISFCSFVHTLFINAYSTNISIYVTENITSNTAVTGLVTAVNAAFALLVGATFSKISKVLGKYTMTVSFFAAALGYGIILVMPGLAGVFITSALCGISLSCFMANGTYLISLSVEQSAVAKASGIFSVIGGIGGLIAPLALAGVSEVALGSSSSVNEFVVSFAGMMITAMIILIVTCGKKSTQSSTK